MTATTFIATRKSPLALKQTELVRAYLAEKLPEGSYESLGELHPVAGRPR